MQQPFPLLQQLVQFIINGFDIRADNDLTGVFPRTDDACCTCRFYSLLIDLMVVLDHKAQAGSAVAGRYYVVFAADAFQNVLCNQCVKELMIYGPGQFHTQYTDDSHNASYLTVLFDMRNLTPVEQEVWYDALINRVFHYDQKINSLIKAFVRESTTGIPYMNSLMLCLLTEIIIRLLQGTYASPMNQSSNSVHKSAMDELFDRIIAYIDENIYLPLTIPEICEHFSLSRTALQLMFKNSIDQSPKKYINDKKLERSCQMLLENRYTISEISLRLGYTSIHYFSKSFNMKYHMSPSEFVKQNLQIKK